MVQHDGRSAVPKNRLALPGLATTLHPWSSLSPLYLWSQILSAQASFSTPKVALAPSGAWELQIDFFSPSTPRSTRFPSGRLLTASWGSQPIRRRWRCERHLWKVSVCLLEPRRGERVPNEDEEEEAVARRPPAFFSPVSVSHGLLVVVFILATTTTNWSGCKWFCLGSFREKKSRIKE